MEYSAVAADGSNAAVLVATAVGRFIMTFARMRPFWADEAGAMCAIESNVEGTGKSMTNWEGGREMNWIKSRFADRKVRRLTRVC